MIRSSKNGVAAGIAMLAAEETKDGIMSVAYYQLFPNMLGQNKTLPWEADFSGMVWQRPGEGKVIGPFVPQAGSASGTLVGLAIGKNGPVPAAFKNGKIGFLPAPEGVKMAVPLAASDADIFVGAGVEGEKVKPVGWSNGKTGFLPVPGGRQGVALGINDAKTVVGSIETESGEAHAAVWKGGKVVDLNDVIDKYPGWTLVQARGINNKGFVVGTAFHKEDGVIRAFVVGPVK